MKVPFKKSIKYKLLIRIERLRSDVVLRKDLDDLGEERQVSRALKSLVNENVLAKLGYGVYGKLIQSKYGGSYLPNGFLAAGREALTRLKVKWEPSEEEKAYNERRSTQVPVNPSTRILSRFNRLITYKGRSLYFE